MASLQQNLTDNFKHSVHQIVRRAKCYIKSEPHLNLVENTTELNLLDSETGSEQQLVAQASIPQAGIVERRLKAYQAKDWRTYFSNKLSGRGLEIGPLHRPMVRHSGMELDYIDRCTVAELRAHYPELRDLPLVEPTIIGDAETMSGVGDKIYDFLISAHVIEHTKNPLGSLKQWCRVVKPGGLIYLIVPDKRATFDIHRVRSTLPHMILDYQRPESARDYEHYLDYAIHVHGKSGTEAIAEADRLLQTDYSIHFHVFLPGDVLDLLQWFSLNIMPLEIVEGPVMAPGSDEFHFLLRV